MLTPWKKSYDQPRQHIKNLTHYFADKGLSSQSYGFSGSHVWMWELVHKESWVPYRTDAFGVPWTARRSNKSIIKEISPEYSLEGLMLKLKLQYFGHLMQMMTHWTRPWCWERLKAWWKGDNRGWDGWMASLTWWTGVWASSGSWWWTRKPVMLQSIGLQRIGHNWATEVNWMTYFQHLER